MRKEILDKVMQLLDIPINTKIRYHKRGDQTYIYQYSENGLTCISHNQGYPCDYIIIGLLLEGDTDIHINNKIDYKKCFEDLCNCILDRREDCESAIEVKLYNSILEYANILKIRHIIEE